jgi:hypothetical protein
MWVLGSKTVMTKSRETFQMSLWLVCLEYGKEGGRNQSLSAAVTLQGGFGT